MHGCCHAYSTVCIIAILTAVSLVMSGRLVKDDALCNEMLI